MVEGTIVKADHIVVATGHVPRTISISGAKYLKVSDDFLNLKKLPKQIVFVGAGYIGMEFTHMAARAGAKVTMIDMGKIPLNSFDSDLVKALTDYS